MLVKFTIEPDALSDAKYDHIFNLLKNHWRPYGILVFKVSLLDNALPSCDHNVKDLLKESYKNFKSTGYPLWLESNNIDWENIDTPDDLARYHAKFELALIEETRALEFGVPEYKTKYCGSVEAAELRNVSASDKFETASQLAHLNIRRNTRVDTIWNKRFSRLAEVSEEVTIVDRYAAWNFCDGNRKVELSKLFKFLDQDSRGCKVTIYSALDGDRYTINPDDIADALLVKVRDLQLTNIQEVILHMPSNDVFSDHFPDRYIRFDKITCIIGHGIEVFRRARCQRDTTFSFKPSRFIDDTKAIEQAFLNAAGDNTVHLAFHAERWSIV